MFARHLSPICITLAFTVVSVVTENVFPEGTKANSPAASTAWPCWRGPYRNGTSLETGWSHSGPTTGRKVLWKASGGKGFSSFAVADGRVFTMGNATDVDTVFCLDAETGKVLWKHSYPCPLTPLAYEGGPSATPAVDGHRV